MKKIALYISLILLLVGAVYFTSCSSNNAFVKFEFKLNYDMQSYTLTDAKITLPSKVKIPNSYKGLPITNIDHRAFYNCENLIGVIIPDSVKSIGHSAFASCYNLKNVEFGNSLETIGDYAFHCTDIVNLVIPDSVRSIGESAFQQTELQGVIIGDSVATIGDSAFALCDDLTTVVMGNSVKTIGHTAFSKCKSLKSIVIPKSVQSIGVGVFGYCDSLTGIQVDPNNSHYKSIDGNLYTRDGIYLVQYAVGKEELTFEVPGSVNGIYSYAFASSNLQSIVITDFVWNLSVYSFYGSDSLTSIAVDEANPVYKSVDGVLYTNDGKTLILYPASKTNRSFTVPDSVETIGECAFLSCDHLESVVIPGSVININDDAFWGCKWLQNVELGNSVEHIGNNAFYNCDIIGELLLPNSLKYIGESAFRNNDLERVVIPSSVDFIGDKAFESCYYLSIYCEATSKPDGWSDLWDVLCDFGSSYSLHDVYWGYTGE